MCVCACGGGGGGGVRVSPGANGPDKSPLTLSCLTAQTVFAQWINDTHTLGQLQWPQWNRQRHLPNLTRNNTRVCGDSVRARASVRVNRSIFRTYPAACWGRPTPGPSPLRFSAAETGAGPRDNRAPSELAASAAWREKRRFAKRECNASEGKERLFIPPPPKKFCLNSKVRASGLGRSKEGAWDIVENWKGSELEGRWEKKKKWSMLKKRRHKAQNALPFQLG